ncbi:MAG: DUF2442 domain-containing protein, partial [Ignavibacteriae bacterium]|nr:DUF2442 domain-containing protein [Ignavibacteriota bacterium]
MAIITSVDVIDGFCVRLTFADGISKTVDLAQYLRGDIFDSIRKNPSDFQQVFVDEELGTIAWPNGADIDPDVLRDDLIPA